MLEISSIQIAALGLLLTAVVALWSLFKLVTNTADAVRKELMAEVDKQAAIQSKSRHDEKGSNANLFLKLDADIERLKRETVRKEDMLAIEVRLTAAVAKIETKVDTITDKIAGFRTLEKQIESIDARLDQAIRRLETPAHATASLVMRPPLPPG